MRPPLASRSASVLPSRSKSPGIHWTLTRFDKPMVARTVQMEQYMVPVLRAGPRARHWINDLESVRTLIPWQAWQSCKVRTACRPAKQAIASARIFHDLQDWHWSPAEYLGQRWWSQLHRRHSQTSTRPTVSLRGTVRIKVKNYG